MRRSLLPYLFGGLLAVPWVPSAALGSGFGLFTQGAAALGEADAVIAHAERPASLFFNPALINRLPGTQVELGTTLVFPRRSFTGEDGSSASTRDTLFTPTTLYLTHVLNQDLSAGLGVFSPFGLGTDWGGVWSGRYLVTHGQLNSYNVNPALSWRPSPSLSLAAGFDILIVDAILQGKVPISSGGATFDIAKRFSGSGTAVGYNLGVLVELGGGVTLGVSYRSPVEVRLSGELSVGNVVTPQVAGSLTLPDQLCAGVAWRATDRLHLETGMRWEGWSSLTAFKLELPTGGTLGPETGGGEDPKKWRDTFSVNFGGDYQVTAQTRLSAGYLFGFTPVPDQTLEPALADADSHLFCMGAQSQWERMWLDLGYGYQMLVRRTKTTNLYGPVADGRYRAELHLVGVSLGYRF